MSKSNHLGIDPYRALWVAVVLQAVRDACEPYVRVLRQRQAVAKANKERVMRARLNGAKEGQIRVIEKQNNASLDDVRVEFHPHESQAERWILSNDRDTANSFVNICESVGLDAVLIRQKVVSGTAERWFVDKHNSQNRDAA